jgi:hypothetical protein
MLLFLLLFLLSFVNSKELVAPPFSGSSFGHAVSVFGDWSAVGDPFSGAGRVFVFKRGVNDTWDFITSLGHVDVAFGDEFGYSVSVGTEYIAVGAPNQFEEGRVYVYRYFEEEWKLSSVLTPPLSYQFGRFGITVSLEDDKRIVVGHPGADFMLNMGAGLVNVYHLVGWGSWYLTNSIHPTGEIIPYSNFGSHVVAHGNRILIAAPFHNQGMVYLFKLVNHRWHLERTLEGDGDDSFGRFIGMSDSNIIVASNSKVFTFFDYGDRVSIINKGIYAMAVSKNLLILSTAQMLHTYTFSHGKWYLVEQIFDEKTYSTLSVEGTTLIMGETYSNHVTSISEYYFTAVPTSSPSISPTAAPLAPTTISPTTSPTQPPTNEQIEISNTLIMGTLIPLGVLLLSCVGICVCFRKNKEKIKEMIEPHI